MGRTQPQLQLVSVAWTGHTSPGSLAPDVRPAEGGRRLERPPPAQPLLTGAANTSPTGRRPATSCPQGRGVRVGGDPCAPLPGREEQTLPWGGRQGPGGQDPAGTRSRAGGWGRGGKAEKTPTESRHTGLDPSGWTRRTRPRPPDKPARVQATAAQGWARSPASERDPSKMPVGTAPDSKGGG